MFINVNTRSDLEHISSWKNSYISYRRSYGNSFIINGSLRSIKVWQRAIKKI
jgi:hypothetical protein